MIAGEFVDICREIRVIRRDHRHTKHLAHQPPAQSHRPGRGDMDRVELLAIRPFENLQNRGEIERKIGVIRKRSGEQGNEVLDWRVGSSSACLAPALHCRVCCARRPCGLKPTRRWTGVDLEIQSGHLRSAHPCRDKPPNAIHLIQRIREQPHANRPRINRCFQPGDLAKQMPLFVLMKHRKVIWQQHKLLRQDRRDRIKQPGEAGVVDALADRGRDPLRHVAVDLGHEVEHLRMLAQRRQAVVDGGE